MKTYLVLSVRLNMVKIGRSKDSGERILSFATGNPDELRLLGEMDGDHEMELHARFARWRVHDRREWFHVHPEIEAFVRQQFGATLLIRRQGQAKGKSRIYWRERGGERRAYADFRDLGGGREALKADGDARATTDPVIAEFLVGRRLMKLLSFE